MSRDIIKKIQASSKSLETLLNSLLDISKLEADLFKPAVRRFTIGELTQRLAEEVGPLAEVKGLRLRHVASSLPVMSDPGLLDRVLRNLLANAVANTERGRVLLGCRRRGAGVAIEVWDTGIGIANDQKRLIFQEFYQGEAAALRSHGGLGLGLAIVERLLGLLGHGITVESEVGRGSVFRVAVPIAESTAATRQAAAEDMDDGAASGALIVGIDDDPAVRDALSMLLQSWGFEAVIAGSEQEAANRLSGDNRIPDLVITDFPVNKGTEGGDAIDAIRRRWGQRVPALLLTGDTDPEHLQEASARGFQVVKKPIRPERLKAVVAEQIETTGPGAKEHPRRGGKKSRPRAAANR